MEFCKRTGGVASASIDWITYTLGCPPTGWTLESTLMQARFFVPQFYDNSNGFTGITLRLIDRPRSQ
jgi:hypothetical protein